VDNADSPRMRERMVRQVLAGGPPVSEAVTGALRAVPRHVFLPELEAQAAYRDEAIVTKRSPDGQPTSSSSQPTIMAIMLDQLGLAPGQRVLEIGAGTGYNAALLKHIVGPEGTVVTIDLDPDVAEQARAHLATAGCPDVTVVSGDGAAGYPFLAPYDRVIATVGVSDLAPAWLSQLAPDGRIVVPLDLRGAQRSVAFERAGACWQSRSVVPCGFMRMRGSLAGPERTRVSGDARELAVTLPDGRDVDITAVARALAGPAAECVTGVVAGPAQLFDGLGLWLALNEPRWGVLTGTAGAGGGPRVGGRPGGGVAGRRLGADGGTGAGGDGGRSAAGGGAGVAALARAPVRVQDRRATAGIFAGESFAVLARPDDPGPGAGAGPGPGTRLRPGMGRGAGTERPLQARSARPPAFTLCVLGYGPDGAELAAELAAQVGAWDAAGRPGTDGLAITACPKPSRPAQPAGSGAVISRPHTTFTVSAGR
jgi:protein-L-isoaspartate(D-aspartate) O-methyltransferase